MRIVIFGATGPCGTLLAREALSVIPSCTLVLYVRSPEKIPDDLSSHPSVKIVQGQLDDIVLLSEVIAGVDAVISSLGPSTTKFNSPDTPIAHGYGHIIDAMHKHNVSRLIALGTASIKAPEDKFNLKFSLLVNGVAITAPYAYRDIVAVGETIRTQGADLDWTIARVPILTENESKQVFAGFVGDGKTNTQLARAGFAAFVIKELLTGEWVKVAPLICSV